MREGYGNRVCVCLCICVCVTTLAATYLVLNYMSELRLHTVSCRFLKICIVWTLLKMFCLGDVASFTCHDDRQLSAFSTKNTPKVLDMIIEMAQYINRWLEVTTI